MLALAATLVLALAPATVAPSADECGTARTSACKDADTDFYADRISLAFPDDLASDWRVRMVAACDDDGEMTCVEASHPTAWGNTRAVFSFVFDQNGDITAAYVAGQRLF